MRPKNPGKDEINFQVITDFFAAGFLRGDVYGSGQIILLATEQQLAYLAKCKRWYIDGTFKLVDLPFRQLFTINGFLKSKDGSMKQVPLAFVLMTSRKAADYVAVFEEILRLVRYPSVVEIVSDFEKAIWVAIRKVLPSVRHFGCSFHWAHAVMKKVHFLIVFS